MKKIMLVATEEEKEVAHSTWPHFDVLVTGVGAINAIRCAKAIPEDTLIINFGYAGSTRKEDIGKIFAISESKLLHDNCEYDGDTIKLTDDGERVCYTFTDFVTKTTKDGLFDMELAFIVAVHPNTIAFKKVSDNLNYAEYEKNL